MRKTRILIVDDEVDFTYFVKLNLERTRRYKVREENSGLGALKAARDFRPDLILLDVIMPDVDGCEVAAELLADRLLKEIPFIFLTSMVTRTEAQRQDGILGGRAFIAKPVSAEQLIESIKRSLPGQLG